LARGGALSDAPVRVGLIGCGRVAQRVHLAVLARLPGARLVALAEVDPERRACALQLAPHARPYEDYGELLGDGDVEAVVVALPNWMHARASAAALASGKHLYLEKPLATHLTEARPVLRAWRESDRVGMIGFNFRFNPLYLAAKQRLESGVLGQCVTVRTAFGTAAHELPDWKRRRASGGGVLLDLASHHLDLLAFLFPQLHVRTVGAALQSRHSQEDTAWMTLEMSDGMRVQSTFAFHSSEVDRWEFIGERARMTVDRLSGLNVAVTPSALEPLWLRRAARWFGSLATGPGLLRRLRFPSHESSYSGALAAFVRAVRGGQDVAPDLWDGYRSLFLVTMAEAAARRGTAVDVPEPA
jgi:myo-inositol 2-dehydrogenase/D-chiro-inositol 1-dehydrogenase